MGNVQLNGHSDSDTPIANIVEACVAKMCQAPLEMSNSYYGAPEKQSKAVECYRQSLRSLTVDRSSTGYSTSNNNQSAEASTLALDSSSISDWNSYSTSRDIADNSSIDTVRRSRCFVKPNDSYSEAMQQQMRSSLYDIVDDIDIKEEYHGIASDQRVPQTEEEENTFQDTSLPDYNKSTLSTSVAVLKEKLELAEGRHIRILETIVSLADEVKWLAVLSNQLATDNKYLTLLVRKLATALDDVRNIVEELKTAQSSSALCQECSLRLDKKLKMLERFDEVFKALVKMLD